MAVVLWGGVIVGGICGVFHAVYLFLEMRTAGVGRRLYYGLWAFGLWALFGAYVLILWLVAAAAWLIFKAGR